MTPEHPDPAPLPDAGADAVSRRPWETAVRARLDPPIERAAQLTRRAIAWFPIRVWRHFLQHNGFLLAAGISYQSLFAIFGVIYLAFAIVGLWLGGSATAIDGLIRLINGYIPGIIGEHGLVEPEQVAAVASGSGGLLTVTGAVALVVVVWTAIGFITYTRRAVRDTFGLPFDRRSYVVLKARDFLAAVLFGLALLVGAALGTITTGAVDLVFSLFGWGDSIWSRVVARGVSPLVAFTLNTLALAALFRLLTGTALGWRRMWPGALLGGAAIAVLQLAAAFLFVYTPSNPLLATFAIFIGFLLWFRLNGIVILVSAAWIAVAAEDRDLSLEPEAERRRSEEAALLVAARVRVREAVRSHETAPWYRRPATSWRLRRARAELRAREAAPAPDRESLGLD